MLCAVAALLPSTVSTIPAQAVITRGEEGPVYVPLAISGSAACSLLSQRAALLPDPSGGTFPLESTKGLLLVRPEEKEKGAHPLSLWSA